MLTLATFLLTTAQAAEPYPTDLASESSWSTEAEEPASLSLDEDPTPAPGGPRLQRIGFAGPLPQMGITHGFRIGYAFMKLDGTDEDRLESSHLFTVGYEVQQRILGGGWLNVLVVENVMVSGINQSKFIPTGNLLLGFEFWEQLQVGAGINLSPLAGPDEVVHMVMGVGYTPQVGSFNVPLHASFIPDIDGNWSAQLTTGVNW